jgi:hypothetical protein
MKYCQNHRAIATRTSITSSVLKKAAVLGSFVFSFFFSYISSYEAAHATASTLGDAIQSTAESTSLIPNLVSAIAYILGAALIGVGLFKARDYSNAPQQIKISDPIKHLAAGGLLVASPSVAGAIVNTIGMDGATPLSKTAGTLSAPGGPATMLDEMVVALVTDISGPLGNLFSAFAYIAGAVLLIVGLHRLTKSSQEGPRGPATIGTFGTFLSAAILLSSSQVMHAISSTFFNNDSHEVAVYAEIFGMNSVAPVDHAEDVVTAILAFMMIVGVISFLRGIFVLRGFSDGNSQMTLMGGLSHVIAGVLAINLGPLLTIIQETLGLSGLSAGLRFN